MAKRKAKARGNKGATTKGFKAPAIKDVRVTTGEEKRKKREKAEEKLRRKKFGKLGKKIPKSRVPDEPHFIKPKALRKPKGISKKKWKTKRPVFGFVAIVHGRGSGSEPGRELFVSKKAFFENSKRAASPRTIAGAKKEYPAFVARLRRKYQGRLDPISIEVKYITRNRAEDRKHHFDKVRRKKK